jgi:hypothetical protein
MRMADMDSSRRAEQTARKAEFTVRHVHSQVGDNHFLEQVQITQDNTLSMLRACTRQREDCSFRSSVSARPCPCVHLLSYRDHLQRTTTPSLFPAAAPSVHIPDTSACTPATQNTNLPPACSLTCCPGLEGLETRCLRHPLSRHQSRSHNSNRCMLSFIRSAFMHLTTSGIKAVMMVSLQGRTVPR